MCRPSKTIVRAIAVLAALLSLAAPLGADDVADFLARHGLDELLALHLQEQLEATPPDQRGPLVQRLATLYAALLERTEDPADRAVLEQRSRAVLAAAPEHGADELRLALLRGAYRGAERIAENHRLRLATPEELVSAKQTLTEIVPRLVTLRQHIDDAAQSIERRLGRADGEEARQLEEQLARQRSLASSARFVEAWALYYQSWLNERADNAKVAQSIFIELLDPERRHLEPSEVSIDLRELEPMARCILGIGLCKALTASTPTAIEWIELLDHPAVFPALREQAPGWKIAIYGTTGDHHLVLGTLQDHLAGGGEVPVAWLRLAAVSALEAADRSRDAGELVDFVLGALAARGELEQILDLAERYGAERLGSSGFALRYVRGVIAYGAAREAHGDDRPAVEPALRQQYDQAIGHLRAALAETDAAAFPEAAAAAERLVAWCLYFQGEYLEAQVQFERAAERLKGAESAEALWMAIVSLDRVVKERGGASLEPRLEALMTRFLEEHPESAHAPQLILRRATGAAPDEQVIAQLLAIPPASEAAGPARRRAAEMLYRLLREADDERYADLARRYLALATTLLAEDARQLDALGADDRQRYIVRCRRVLEVALDERAPELPVARDVLRTLEEQVERGAFEAEPALRAELAWRRVALALLENDADRASAAAEELWSSHPDSRWSRLAARAVFREAWQRLRAGPEGSGLSGPRDALESVVAWGGRILHEFEQDAALAESGVLNYFAAVAEAAMELWQRGGDPAMGRRALFLYSEKLLPARPDNAGFLRATGLLAEQFDDAPLALEAWRTLLAGTPVGGDPWFEAKLHLIATLAKVDPPRAREVMDQHMLLHPEYGPPPWGARLRELDAQIPPGGGGDDDARDQPGGAMEQTP